MTPAVSTPSLPPVALASARLGEPSAWLWRAGQMSRAPCPTAPTGWPALDAELPGGGWPMAGMTELLSFPASGELALLAPWLRDLGHRAEGPRELLWVAPPGQPCAAALAALGLAPSGVVCIAPAAAADAAWATEQALRAGCCAAVLWWQTQAVPAATLRRLHLAAQSGATPLMALRPPSAHALSSPAPLRLTCTPLTGRQVAIEVFKRRGPPMAAPLNLSLPWPGLSRRLRVPAGSSDAVDRPLPAAPAAASLGRVAARA